MYCPCAAWCVVAYWQDPLLRIEFNEYPGIVTRDMKQFYLGERKIAWRLRKIARLGSKVFGDSLRLIQHIPYSCRRTASPLHLSLWYSRGK
jgi:hypothetical protein